MQRHLRWFRVPLLLAVLAGIACEGARELFSVLSAVHSEFPQQSAQVTRNNDGDLVLSLSTSQPGTLDSAGMTALAWRAASIAAKALPVTDSSRTVAVLLWQKAQPFAVPFAARFPIDSLRAVASK